MWVKIKAYFMISFDANLVVRGNVLKEQRQVHAAPFCLHCALRQASDEKLIGAFTVESDAAF